MISRTNNLLQGGEDGLSRQAHNLENAGSNPAPATTLPASCRLVAPRGVVERADSTTHAALAEGELTGPIMASIAEADVHQLIYIKQVKIPHCKGISDEERDGLKRAAQARFIELNQMRGDVSVTKKNLTTGFYAGSLHTSEEKTGTKNDGSKQ